MHILLSWLSSHDFKLYQIFILNHHIQECDISMLLSLSFKSKVCGGWCLLGSHWALNVRPYLHESPRSLEALYKATTTATTLSEDSYSIAFIHVLVLSLKYFVFLLQLVTSSSNRNNMTLISLGGSIHAHNPFMCYSLEVTSFMHSPQI